MTQNLEFEWFECQTLQNRIAMQKIFFNNDLRKIRLADRETVRNLGEQAIEPARLDLRGLRCPLPVLKIRKALLRLDPGAELKAATDDPLAGLDVPNLLRETGDELLATERDGAAFVFRIRRGN